MSLSGEGEISLDGFAADLAAVCAAAGQDRVTLLPGHAAWIYAIAFAARFPDRVSGIVWLGPNIQTRSPMM